MTRFLLLSPLALASLLSTSAWANPGHEDLLGSFIGKKVNASIEAAPEDDVLMRFIGARQQLFANKMLPSQAAAVPAPAPAASAAPAKTQQFDTHTLMMSDVVVTAMGYLGKPYSYGSSSLSGGFDCSGFVLSLYERSIGRQLPRRAVDQAAATQKISKSELRPGDLVFFNTLRRQYSHVGIYIGEGRFIHSPRAGARIRVESMEKSYWQTRFNGARRVTADAVTVASR